MSEPIPEPRTVRVGAGWAAAGTAKATRIRAFRTTAMMGLRPGSFISLTHAYPAQNDLYFSEMTLLFRTISCRTSIRRASDRRQVIASQLLGPRNGCHI